MIKDIMKKYSIQIIIAIVFLFSITMIYTYAFFSSELKNENGPHDIITETGTLLLTYDGTQAVSLLHAFPGDTLEKTFTVKNDGTLEAAYDVLWRDVLNRFADKGDLVYTLTCESDNEEGECREVNTMTQMPNTTSNQEIVKNVSIKPEETHTYKFNSNIPL